MGCLIAYPCWIILKHHVEYKLKIIQSRLKSLFWIDLCSFYFKLKFLVNLEVIDSITSHYYRICRYKFFTPCYCGKLGAMISWWFTLNYPIITTFEYDLSKTNEICMWNRKCIVQEITIFLLWIGLMLSKDTCTDIFLVRVNLVTDQYELFLLMTGLLLFWY